MKNESQLTAIANQRLRTQTAAIIASLARAKSNITITIQHLDAKSLRALYGSKFQLAVESIEIAIEILQTAHDDTPATPASSQIWQQPL